MDVGIGENLWGLMEVLWIEGVQILWTGYAEIEEQDKEKGE